MISASSVAFASMYSMRINFELAVPASRAGARAETELGGGIIGVVDGLKSLGIETEKDIVWRKELLRKIGYKQ